MISTVRNLSNSEFTQTSFKTKKAFAEKSYCFFFLPLGANSSHIKNQFLVWKSEMSVSS